MKEYYVWYDLFLEEHFCLEKEELDSKFLNLKNQLLKEKISFNIIQAQSTTEAYAIYHQNNKLAPVALSNHKMH